jgi:hypothetical protein
MDDVNRVRRREPRARLDVGREDLLPPARRTFVPLLERLAFEERDDEDDLAVLVEDVVDGDDVRMIEAREGAGFLEETFVRMRVLRSVRVQYLERNLALELGA